MRALGFQVKKREVLELVEEVDINRSGRVEFSDYMEISTCVSSSLMVLGSERLSVAHSVCPCHDLCVCF